MVQQNHPLIPRGQKYILNRKLVSIHSYDRDIKKWPNSNYFEIDLPSNLKNIQSMRLLNITLPSNQYVFSNEYQNTKFKFTISLKGIGNIEKIIIIDEGAYTPTLLAMDIETKMNKSIAADPKAKSPSYNGFRCKYNVVTNKFWFGNTSDTFILNFDQKIKYNTLCHETMVWDNYTRWGLPAYLGYKKKKYESTLTPPNPWWSNSVGDPFGFDFETIDGSGTEWLNHQHTNQIINIDDTALFSTDPNDPNCIGTLDIMGNDNVYMEVVKYNSMDEIEPYSENTCGLYNNDYAGKINSAFAKIPIQNVAFAKLFDSTRAFIANISHYNPPIERINRLRFKFRYHDGRLVDFKSNPFSFTLEFNMLRDEITEELNVSVPALYCL